MIQGIDRWCLWLVDAESTEINQSAELVRRVSEVRKLRSQSRRPGTLKAARTPHLFGENRQPHYTYLAIPQTFSENRDYATVSYLGPEVITNKKLFTAQDPDGILFAVLSSSMFITWQKLVGGRLKSDPSFSNTVVWNNLPLPAVSDKLREQMIEAGKGVLAARGLHSERTLAEHYNPLSMDPALIAAHDNLDRYVDKAFGATRTLQTNEERRAVLLRRYREMTSDPGSDNA